MRFSTTAALLCAAATTVTTAQAQTTSQPQANDAKPVMVMGCVARADMSHADGVKGVTGRDVNTGGDADKFVLTNTRMSTEGATKQEADDRRIASPAVTSGSSDALAMDAPRYALDGQAADLRQHLGHQVEITGRWAMPSDTRSGAVGTSGRTTSAGVESGQTLHVQSVRMIAATCTVK